MHGTIETLTATRRVTRQMSQMMKSDGASPPNKKILRRKGANDVNPLSLSTTPSPPSIGDKRKRDEKEEEGKEEEEGEGVAINSNKAQETKRIGGPPKKIKRSDLGDGSYRLLFLHVGCRSFNKNIIHACDMDGNPYVVVNFMEGITLRSMNIYLVKAKRTVSFTGRLQGKNGRGEPFPKSVQLTLHKDLGGEIKDEGPFEIKVGDKGDGANEYNPYRSIESVTRNSSRIPFHCSISGIILKDAHVNRIREKSMLRITIADSSLSSAEMTLWGIEQVVSGRNNVPLDDSMLKEGRAVGVIGLKYDPGKCSFVCDPHTRLIIHDPSEDLSYTIRESEGMIRNVRGMIGTDEAGNEFDERFLCNISNISRVRKLTKHNWKNSWFCNEIPCNIEVSHMDEEGPFYNVCRSCKKYSKGSQVCRNCCTELNDRDRGVILTIMAYDLEPCENSDGVVPFIKFRIFTETIRDYLRNSRDMEPKQIETILSGDEMLLGSYLEGRKDLTICLTEKKGNNGRTYVEREIKSIRDHKEDTSHKEKEKDV